MAKTSQTTTKKSTVKKAATTTAKKTPAKADATKNLSDLYEDGLKDIYWAEKNLLKALPKMEKNATNPQLKKSIVSHMKETETHIERLVKCFEKLKLKPKAEKCDAMAGLLEEGEGIIKSTEVGAVRDAGIIAAAQKVEHYEIATYGTLAAFAKVLGHKQSVKLLIKTLEEEKKCDETLSSIADTQLNTQAKKK